LIDPAGLGGWDAVCDWLKAIQDRTNALNRQIDGVINVDGEAIKRGIDDEQRANDEIAAGRQEQLLRSHS
jgi:hypothetical protein